MGKLVIRIAKIMKGACKMVVENTAKRSFFKTKRGMAILVFLCLLVIDLTMMGVPLPNTLQKATLPLTRALRALPP